jgi:hypothetical protein
VGEEHTHGPDHVLILRAWHDGRWIWRFRVTDQNRRVLGRADGTRRILELLRSIIESWAPIRYPDRQPVGATPRVVDPSPHPKEGTMTFLVTYTYHSDATPKAVWDTLISLNEWPSWDVRLESVRSNGPAKTGGVYFLKPVQGNEIQIRITKADDNVFNDVAKLEFGTIETERTVKAANGGTLITQTMRANINPEFVRTFSKVFWDVWSQGMIDSSKALANAPIKTRTTQLYAQPEDITRLVQAHMNIA